MAPACRSTATRSTRRAPRSRASPSCSAAPTPGTRSATSARSRPPPTTARFSSGARTASTSGPTAMTRTRASWPAASAGCGRAAPRSAPATPTAPPARGPAESSAWATSRRTLASAGFRVDERVYAPLGAGPVLVHEVTIANTTPPRPLGLVVRVLGREPVRPGRPSGRSAWTSPRTRARRPAAHRRPARLGGRPAAADDLRGGPGRAGRRAARPTPRGSSAPASARPPRRGRRRTRSTRRPRRRSSPVPAGRRCSASRAPWRLRPGQRVTLRYAYGIAHPSQIDALVAARRADRRGVRSLAPGVGALGAAGQARARARLALARAAVVGLHAALRRVLRGMPRAADPLAGRLLPVRPRLPGRVPRPAPARASADLRRAGDRPRRAALLGVRAAARGRAGPLRDELAVPAQRRARRTRTTWTCGCSGRPPSTCWRRAT